MTCAGFEDGKLEYIRMIRSANSFVRSSSCRFLMMLSLPIQSHPYLLSFIPHSPFLPFYGELCEIFDEASIASSINPSNCCVNWSSDALWL